MPRPKTSRETAPQYLTILHFNDFPAQLQPFEVKNKALAKAAPGIDIIIGAHTHDVVGEPIRASWE